MSEPKTLKPQPKKSFRYPAEDETYVRRLGSALLACWSDLPPEFRDKVLAEAGQVWDREYHIPQLTQKLESFVKRYPSRLA